MPSTVSDDAASPLTPATHAPTDLIVVRHGETVWNAEGRLQGQADSALTPLGIAQARALGRRLAGMSIARVVSSHLPRTLHTAALIRQEAPALPEAVLLPAVCERSFGVLEGRRVADLTPEERAHYDSAGGDEHYRVPGGESRMDVWERAVTALEDLGRSAPGSTLLVVTHGGVLSVAVRAGLGLACGAPRTFSTPNCAFNLLRFEAGRLVTLNVGDTTHLADLE